MFWALRGGGGGTYGVVTSTTYKTYPSFPLTAAFLTANFSSPAIAQNVTTEFIKFHSTFSDAGWGGYIGLSNLTFSAVFVAPNVSLEDTNATLLPFLQYVEEATGGLVQATTIPFNSFYEIYLILIADINAGEGTAAEVASRLLPRTLVETNPAKTAKILLSLNDGVGIK